MKKSTLIILMALALLKTQAQDYLISFAGAGDTTVVSTVIVDNLTSGASVTLNGGDILHLAGAVGIDSPDIKNGTLKIYPNPITEQSFLTFVSPENSNAVISIVDLSGKAIYQITSQLQPGSHNFRISGMNQGMYFVTVTSKNYNYSTKVICLSNLHSDTKIEHVSSVKNTTGSHLKSTSATIDMSYANGDLLLFKSISGPYSTIVTDVPTSSKEIAFNFVSCTDNDGNNYTTVKIGSQVWMAENLKTTKFRNGDIIPDVSYDFAWNDITTPAMCGNPDVPNYVSIYGRLYNWYAVADSRNICPAAWHVSTDAEWTRMTDYLGGENVAGSKLKETGTTLWNSPNNGTTNESGFFARPGSFRSLYAGIIAMPGDDGSWWTSTESDANQAFNRFLFNNDATISRVDNDKRAGFSVRCVKDLSSDTAANVLKHNNVEYPTPNGMLVFKELINPGLCRYDLKIYSSNFTFNSSTGDITGIDGIGKIITFYAISPIQLEDVNADGKIDANDIVMNNLVLEEGQYSCSSDYIAKTFEADFTTSANNTSDYIVYSIASGILNVSRSGDVYEITYDGLDENGLSIKGNFKGQLTVVRNQ